MDVEYDLQQYELNITVLTLILYFCRKMVVPKSGSHFSGAYHII